SSLGAELVDDRCQPRRPLGVPIPDLLQVAVSTGERLGDPLDLATHLLVAQGLDPLDDQIDARTVAPEVRLAWKEGESEDPGGVGEENVRAPVDRHHAMTHFPTPLGRFG